MRGEPRRESESALSPHPALPAACSEAVTFTSEAELRCGHCSCLQGKEVINLLASPSSPVCPPCCVPGASRGEQGLGLRSGVGALTSLCPGHRGWGLRGRSTEGSGTQLRGSALVLRTFQLRAVMTRTGTLKLGISAPRLHSPSSVLDLQPCPVSVPLLPTDPPRQIPSSLRCPGWGGRDFHTGARTEKVRSEVGKERLRPPSVY